MPKTTSLVAIPSRHSQFSSRSCSTFSHSHRPIAFKLYWLYLPSAIGLATPFIFSCCSCISSLSLQAISLATPFFFSMRRKLASAPALFAFGKTGSQHLANWHSHPPSLPLAKQDHSIFLLTGASSIMTIPSYLSGHAITPCPTSYL
jgi:hypothetical protein